MPESNFNQDELVPPSFLTEFYILDVLKTIEDDHELHLINYEIIPGSNAGDHYASVMFKIITTYGSKGKIISERRFVLKTIPEADGPKKELLEQLPAFKNEILMYTKTLPAMEKILKENGEKGWWPKLVFSTPKPFVLIFEDLTVENYQVVYDPLDSSRINLIVEKLAKYHALSKVLLENGQEEISSYKMEFRPEMKDFFIPMCRQLTQLADVVKTWPGFEDIGRKVAEFAPKVMDKMMQCLMRDNSHEFKVLNHGDFHIRNLMFKKTAEGELSEVIFLDFQMPQYNLPGFDLIGLLNTMGDYEVRKSGEDVIKTYHQLLLDNLRTYGFKGELPTVVDIIVGLLRLSDYHAFSSLILGPIFNLKGIDLGSFFAPEEDKSITNAMQKVFNEPRVKEDLQRTIIMFEKRGVFD